MTEAKTAPGGVIDILDLHQPVLSDLQRAALANTVVPPLEEEAVLEQARKATGLSDFGEPDFRERLRLWLRCAAEDEQLSNVGKAGVYGLAVRAATNRLHVEDLVRRHPQILDLPIDRPLAIAGLPRSGTTHLQNFLAADPQLRSLPYWEAIRPFPAADEVAKSGEIDPRWLKCAAEWERADALMPISKAMHPFDPEHISEDIELQNLNFSSYHIEFISGRSPVWRDYYFAHDQAPTYRYMKKVLQALDFTTGGGRRWLLKCPQHMEQLKAFNSVFPDATLVINHRDPVASIQSAITGNCYRARLRRTVVQPDETAEYWIDRYERLLRACVRDRDTIASDQAMDVYFHELMADPMTQVEAIYRKAGLPIDAALHERWRAFMADNPRGKHGQVRYDLRRDFGLTPEEIRARFQFYMDRFPVRVEVR